MTQEKLLERIKFLEEEITKLQEEDKNSPLNGPLIRHGSIMGKIQAHVKELIFLLQNS